MLLLLIWIIGLYRKNKHCTTESIFLNEVSLVTKEKHPLSLERHQFLHLCLLFSSASIYAVVSLPSKTISVSPSLPPLFLPPFLSPSPLPALSCSLAIFFSLLSNFLHVHCSLKPPSSFTWASVLSA